ncbi:hypothetical protein KKI24_22410 [bacterium]|nr:hypothetical protein [bacterium]
MRIHLLRAIVIAVGLMQLCFFAHILQASEKEPINKNMVNDIIRKKAKKLAKDYLMDRLLELMQEKKQSRSVHILLKNFTSHIAEYDDKELEKKLKADLVFTFFVLSRSRFVTDSEVNEYLFSDKSSKSLEINRRIKEDAALVLTKYELSMIPHQVDAFIRQLNPSTNPAPGTSTGSTSNSLTLSDDQYKDLLQKLQKLKQDIIDFDNDLGLSWQLIREGLTYADNEWPGNEPYNIPDLTNPTPVHPLLVKKPDRRKLLAGLIVGLGIGKGLCSKLPEFKTECDKIELAIHQAEVPVSQYLGLTNEAGLWPKSPTTETPIKRMVAWADYFKAKCGKTLDVCFTQFLVLEELQDMGALVTDAANKQYNLKIDDLKNPDIKDELQAFLLLTVAMAIEDYCKGSCHKKIKVEEIIQAFGTGQFSVDQFSNNEFIALFTAIVTDENSIPLEALASVPDSINDPAAKIQLKQRVSETICKDNAFCSIVADALINSLSYENGRFKIEEPLKIIPSILKDPNLSTELIRLCERENAGDPALCAAIVPQILPLAAKEKPDLDDFKKLIWTVLLNGKEMNEDFAGILMALQQSDKAALFDRLIDYVKREKPFTNYCLTHPHSCVLDLQRCEDSPGPDAGCIEINECERRYAKGVVLTMLDDIPNYLDWSEQDDKYEFNSDRFLTNHIQMIEDVSGWHGFYPYFAIAKSFSHRLDGTDDDEYCDSSEVYCSKKGFFFYHEKIGAKLRPDSWKLGRSTYHATLYTGGLLYQLTPADDDLKNELADRVLVGVELGVFLRETLEINFGGQMLLNNGARNNPIMWNINISFPLTEYLSEIADL